MESIFGHVEIKGSGPRYCAVAVVDTEGNFIGETQSDRHGNWRLSPIALPTGKHVVHAIMRNANGEEFTSDNIPVVVGDPRNEVAIEAEKLDADTVEAMEAIDAEEREAEQLAHAARRYLECVENQARGFEAGTEINYILGALGRSHDQFCADVAQERMKLRYTKVVCMAAAGIELEDNDKRFIRECAGQFDAAFKHAVECTQNAALSNLRMANNVIDE
jgi:hypothetical protein